MMKTFTKILMLLAFSFLTENALAKIIYVNAANGAAVTKDGTTWANAYVSLQDAIGNSVNGDEIWVAKGVYKPSVAPNLLSITSGTQDYTFMVPEGVKLYGGFKGDGTDNITTRDFVTNETILDGDLNGNDDGDDFAKKTDNVFHVVTIVAHSTNTFVVDGFTVQNGYATGAKLTQVNAINYYSFYGGGIFLREAGGTFRNMVVKNNIVNANTASSSAYGGGLFTAGTKDINIENALFIGNKSLNTGAGLSYAGALYIAIPNTTLNNVTFDANEVKSYGGAISLGSGNSIIKNTKFFNNISAANGGAIYITAATTKATFINNLLYNNEAKAASAGGALYVANGTVNLINNTVFGNKATTAPNANGGGVYINNLATAILNAQNTIFLDNQAIGAGKDIAKGGNGTLTITNSLTQGTTGTNVNTTATAADVFKSTTYGDADFLRLRTDDTNPAIDAGDNSKYDALLYGNTDLAGNTRTFNSGLKATATIDMGAYENIITPLPIVLSSALSAKIKGNTVQVNWATASETNNSHFVLEKSTDGVNFVTIAAPVSKGNGANYSHTDFSPVSGNNYYKLTQVDNDGTKVTYETIVVNFSLKANEVNVYPNPAVGGKITINLAGNKFTKLQLVNLQGQSLQSLKIAANETEKTVDISNYPSGTYFIFLSDGTNITTKKVIKP